MPSKCAGFTLLETLVAITLIVVAMSGPFLSAERAFIAALDAKNRMIASYLAQEGVEYVRMLRDTTYLEAVEDGVSNLTNTAFYDRFIDGQGGVATSIRGCLGNHDPQNLPGGDGSAACALDPQLSKGVGGVGSEFALQVCQSPTSCPALYLQENGQYSLSGTGSPSPYTRSIRFYNFGAEVQITVTVAWEYRGTPRSVEIVSYLSPWQ
jgi:prepilin-type N-terminal cleavage/methylation domain-containing protein